MISYEEFEDIVVDILERDISSNKNQQKAILSMPFFTASSRQLL